MKIAIVHEWFTFWAGSENVVEQILACFPDSDIFALIDFLPERDRTRIGNKNVTTSFIQHLPFAKSHYRSYLPLMPLAVKRFNLSGYDLVISSSHAVAKGVVTRPDQIHVSYIHSPMRYAWDLQDQYLNDSGLDRGIKGVLARYLLRRLRVWDARTARNVDYMVANSRFIGERIRKAYNRTADVIYPPVDIDGFTLRVDKGDYYVTASRLVPYKKVDLIVEAFAGMPEKRLVVIGDGPRSEKIRSKAGPNVDFLGYVERDTLIQHLQSAKAFIFAAEEDFGISPIEAQACGTPVIAFGRGGVTESVRGLDSGNPTGLFFSEQTVVSIQAAVAQFESMPGHFSSEACRRNAERFSISRFRELFSAYVRDAVEESHAKNSRSMNAVHKV